MRLRHPLAALLLTAAVVAAGCGGDTEAKNAYVEEVRSAQRAYVTRFDQILERLTPTSTLAEDRATLGSFASVTGSFAAVLRRTEPPEEVREEHGRLVTAVVGYQRRVERASAELRAGSRAQRARVRTELSSSVEDTQGEIAAAVSDINAGLQG